jgi:hypothetical protein
VIYIMSYFFANQNVQTELYEPGGGSTLTLSGFNVVGGATLTATTLYPHFHRNFASNSSLSNTSGFYPPGADNSLLYTPSVQIPSLTTTLSSNQLINSNSNGIYVVVIGGGGGGGGGRNNTSNDNGNGAGSGGSGAIIGYFFDFSTNGVNPSGAYYKYITGAGGTAGTLGTNAKGGTGGTGGASVFQFFNSSNTQIFSLTANGGLGGEGGKQPAEQPPPAQGGAGGTTAATGTAASISTGTINVRTNGNVGFTNNVNAGGAPAVPFFVNQNTNAGAFIVVGTRGNSGNGGLGDGLAAPNGTAGTAGQSGRVLLFELFNS